MSDHDVIITNEEMSEIVSAANETPNDILIDSVRPEIGDEEKTNFLKSVSETAAEHIWNELSILLKTKIEFGFPDIKLERLKAIFSNYSECYLLNFSLADGSEGYIIINHKLATFALQILFGGQQKYLESQYSIKKSKIASLVIGNLTEIFLNSFLKSIPDIKPIPYSILKIQDEFKTKNSLVLNDFYFQFEYGCILNEETIKVALIFPEKVIENLIPMKSATRDNEDRQAIRDQIMSSDVDVRAVIDNIKVQLMDVMSFKVGDLIPLQDPNRVNIIVDNTKIFEGTPLQHNNKVCVCVG